MSVFLAWDRSVFVRWSRAAELPYRDILCILSCALSESCWISSRIGRTSSWNRRREEARSFTWRTRAIIRTASSPSEARPIASSTATTSTVAG